MATRTCTKTLQSSKILWPRLYILSKKQRQASKKSLWKVSRKEEKKNKKEEYVWERYKNLPEDEKQRLAEYRKKYKLWKNKTASQIKTDWCFWLTLLWVC